MSDTGDRIAAHYAFITKMRVPAIKQRLQSKNCSTNGSKGDLVKRLVDRIIVEEQRAGLLNQPAAPLRRSPRRSPVQHATIEANDLNQANQAIPNAPADNDCCCLIITVVDL